MFELVGKDKSAIYNKWPRENTQQPFRPRTRNKMGLQQAKRPAELD